MNAAIHALATRIANLFTRGVVRGSTDSKKVQLLQVDMLSGETRDDLERLQQFGLTGVPEDGAECLVVSLGGRRDHCVVIAVDDRRYRPTGLQKGEVALYDKSGSKLVLKANGDIEATPNSGKFKVTGDLEASGDVKAGAISLKNHTHPKGGLTGSSSCSAGGASVTINGNTGAAQ